MDGPPFEYFNVSLKSQMKTFRPFPTRMHTTAKNMTSALNSAQTLGSKVERGAVCAPVLLKRNA